MANCPNFNTGGVELSNNVKIWVKFKLLHLWHMDFRMFFLWGLHTILLEIDFKQNKTSWKTLITFGDKKSWLPNRPPRWTFRPPGQFIRGHGRPGDLLFYTLTTALYMELALILHGSRSYDKDFGAKLPHSKQLWRWIIPLGQEVNYYDVWFHGGNHAHASIWQHEAFIGCSLSHCHEE